MTVDELVHALEVERARPISPTPRYFGTPSETPGECRRRLEELCLESLEAEGTRKAESGRRKRRNARQRMHQRHQAYERARSESGR